MQSETPELAVFMDDSAQRAVGGVLGTMQLPRPTPSQEKERIFVPGSIRHDFGGGRVATRTEMVRTACRLVRSPT